MTWAFIKAQSCSISLREMELKLLQAMHISRIRMYFTTCCKHEKCCKYSVFIIISGTFLAEVSCINTTFLHEGNRKRSSLRKNSSDPKEKFICSLKKHRRPASCKRGRFPSPDCLNTQGASLVS